MISERRFCAECGKKGVPLKDSFCQNCYWKYFRIAKPRKSRIDVAYCLTCGSLKLPAGWTGANEKNEIPEITAHAYSKFLHTHTDAIISIQDVEEINWLNPNPEFHVSYNISINNVEEFSLHTEEHFLYFKIHGGICKTCVKKKTGTSDVTVQFRAHNRPVNKTEEDIVTNTAFDLVNQLSYESPESYLGEIIEVHGGLDLYFGNTMIADEFITRLKDIWIGHHEKNFKLITEDKEKKRVYRVTHLYRIPGLVAGDYIDLENELYLVDQISKNGIHLGSLIDKSRILVRKWMDLAIAAPAPFPIRKIILSFDKTASSYLIMDLKDYSTEEIGMNYLGENLPIGEEMTLLSWKERYYYDERISKTQDI
ncbi:MAG: NMD3-related protein [Candidatus Kariarchaeaceae archaeon]|jgi:NMD protein affecting ribosome stability and mRNA decay